MEDNTDRFLMHAGQKYTDPYLPL